MKKDSAAIQKQSGVIVLSAAKTVGNATVTVSATPFPLRDTTYYQVGKHGDYIQEAH